MAAFKRISAVAAMVALWLMPAAVNIYLALLAICMLPWIHSVIQTPVALAQIALAVYAGGLVDASKPRCGVFDVSICGGGEASINTGIMFGYVLGTVAQAVALVIYLVTVNFFTSTIIYNGILLALYIGCFFIGVVVNRVAED